MRLSNTSRNLKASPIRKFIPYANDAKAEGVTVYHLNIGQPDIKTPQEFFDAICNFNEDVIKYEDSNGLYELREEISNYYKRYDLDFEIENIIINNGGSEALQMVFTSICDPGDEIIVVEPFYTNYNSFAVLSGINMKAVSANADNGFALPEKAVFEKTINDKTRAILISNPGNPTGAIYSKEELEMLKELALEHDLFIISDEVYREFAYEGLKVTSMASFKEIADRVIIVDSISKRFSACGARIGNVASKNKELMATLLKFAQARLCAPTLEQIGAAALYKMDPHYFDEILKEYENRRNTLYEGLMSIDGIKCKKPRGAFYAVVDLPIDDAEDFVIFMLRDFRDNNETVMLTPAQGFYKTDGLGKNQVRMAYILEVPKLKRCVELLDKGLKAYHNR